MPSETGKSGKDVQGALGDREETWEAAKCTGCPQRQESQERTYKVPWETDGRHGRKQNISVSGRHYSAVSSQKILSKAWDAPRDREIGSWEAADSADVEDPEPTIKQAAERVGFFDPGIPPQLYTLWRGQIHRGVQNWDCFGSGEAGSNKWGHSASGLLGSLQWPLGGK
ncbi:hypothetical protein BGX38DRAFT_1281171 [Terfezia claveryi]|nr:hypothetical protein BGX38DRAFT_1281171 [Terfezia claveryi]